MKVKIGISGETDTMPKVSGLEPVLQIVRPIFLVSCDYNRGAPIGPPRQGGGGGGSVSDRKRKPPHIWVITRRPPSAARGDAAGATDNTRDRHAAPL